MQLLVWYLALPQVGLIFDPIYCAIGALGMNYGAYMTEIFRAGIQAVPLGQREAAAALGMSSRTAFLRIVAPQAFRIIVPAIGNDFVAMLKDSALASTVALQEIVWRARNVGQKEFKTLQTFIIAAMIYWALTIISRMVSPAGSHFCMMHASITVYVNASSLSSCDVPRVPVYHYGSHFAIHNISCSSLTFHAPSMMHAPTNCVSFSRYTNSS